MSVSLPTPVSASWQQCVSSGWIYFNFWPLPDGMLGMLGFVHPLQDVAFHQCLPLSSVCCFPVPGGSLFLAMSSCHLLHGRPLDLFPLLGCHSVQHMVNLLSFILAICPAHLHFCFSVYSIMSIICVLFLITEHGILSCSFRFNMFFSIAARWRWN